MTEYEPVDVLMEGVEKWNKWVEEQRKADADFKADLHYVDLRKENIKDTPLYNPDEWSKGAFLRGAHLEGAGLLDAHLEGVDLSGAYLDRANLEGAYLESACFGNAQLKEANLHGAHLEKADLESAQLPRVNLRYAHLDGAKLIFSQLQEASLTGAQLQGADLLKAQLQGVYLESAKMQKANLCYACLDGAALFYVHLEKAKLGGAHLEGADLSNAHLEEADLESVQLARAKLRSVFIEGASFKGAEMEGAELIISSLNSKTSFRDTRFSNCLISIGDEVDQDVAIQVLSQGMVNNVQFVDPVFGRKVRDQAWLNKWRENIRQRKPDLKKWIKKFEWRGKQNYLGYFGNRLLQFMWWCTSNYGRNIWLWILWSFGLILFFAWKYFSLRTDHYKIDIAIIEKYQGFPAYLYYSVVTFTTLGFGDITAKTYKGMFWASLEVILGYIMLGGLISIFATKFARRND